MTSGIGRRSLAKLTVRELQAWLRTGIKKPGQKLSDGGGLYAVAMASGRASWQLRYSLGGRPSSYAIGPVEEITLADARRERARVIGQVDQGLDPVRERQAVRAEGVATAQLTFKVVSEEWLDKQAASWSAIHLEKSRRALERDVYPTLGKLPIGRITTRMISGVIETIQSRGVRETAAKILQQVMSIFRYAQAKGLRPDNPAAPVQEVLERAPEVVHHPALLSFSELGDVLRRAEVSNLSPVVRLAHRLIAYSVARIGNVVSAKWAQFDLEGNPATWRLPRDEMKVKGGGRVHDHVIILSRQIAFELRRWKLMQPADSVYVFPGHGGRSHLSRESIEKALRETMKLAGKHSPHGWRSAFSTRAREDTDFDSELVDLCLDHVHASEVALAYDRGQRLAKRVALMDWWGNSLEMAEALLPT